MKPFPQPSWIALALLATATAPADAGEFPLCRAAAWLGCVESRRVTVGAGYRALDVSDPQLVGAGADAEFPDPHGARRA
jgi:hypothetical protein